MSAPTTPDAAAVELDELADIVAAYVDFDAKARQLADARDGLRRIIEARLAEAEVGTINGRPRVRRTRYLDRRIDTRRLRDRAPADLLADCTVETERVRFSLVDTDPTGGNA